MLCRSMARPVGCNQVVALQLDEKTLEALRLKPGFRVDGKTFSTNRSISLIGAKHHLARVHTMFIGGIATVVKASTGMVTDNWRVTVNALLVLDKVKLVSQCGTRSTPEPFV